MNIVQLLPAILFFLQIPFWFVALWGAIFRKDLKHQGEMWMVLIAAVPFAFIGYFFKENRLKLGYTSSLLLFFWLISVIFDIL